MEISGESKKYDAEDLVQIEESEPKSSRSEKTPTSKYSAEDIKAGVEVFLILIKWRNEARRNVQIDW